MLIGIDASRAFSGQRTGIEEYALRVIESLADKIKDERVRLYVRKGQHPDFDLPKNWRIKMISWPFFWTQLGLSLEMFFHPADVLFVPSHVVPLIHPKKTIVTIHGLEYEFFPQGYSLWERLYMRWSIRSSCRWAAKIIAVSENTKKDLMTLYRVPEEKVEVIYEGTSGNFQFPIFNSQSISNDKNLKPYLLSIGRLEARKNILGIIKAFEILKKKYKIPHKLILAGKFGHGAEKIKRCLAGSPDKSDIILPGFVSDDEKRVLFQNADVFLFPSFYEGFGLPVLEAQATGVPVVASSLSSLPEVAGEGALLVDPARPEELAQAAYRLVSDKSLRDDIIKKGHKNIERFSWSECGRKIAKLLV